MLLVIPATGAANISKVTAVLVSEVQPAIRAPETGLPVIEALPLREESFAFGLTD